MYSDAEIEKMKEWLGQGEMDIDLAIRMGACTIQRLIEICETLTDSPWFKPTT